MENELIRDVAIYLRKSRGDVDTDLAKHRMALIELCKKMRVNFKEYAEIGTSDSIQDRPVFCELLKDIEQELYDAVAVMDIDRLGRGDDQDWGRIEKSFREAEVFIITPDKIYDWENESDEFQLDVKKFFARLEYKQITKRLRRGKTLGAKGGKWTNGKPPYPYIYNKIKQQLDVDKEKYKVYRQIIDMALSGVPANQIAWELNKLGIKSPGGSYWHNNAVYRLLKDQTHLGKVVFAKQKGSGHKNRKTKPLKMINENDWIIVDGQHEALKTQEEHDRIMELLAKRKIIPTAARHGAFVLSGLVHCGKCGYGMGITYNGKNHIEYIKKCQHHSPIGEKCDNPGTNTDIIVQSVFDELEKYENKILNSSDDVNDNETELIKSALIQKQRILQKDENALDNLIEMREDGEITKDKYLQRKKIREENINKTKKEVQELQERFKKREQATNKKRLQNIKEFRKLWETADSAQLKNQFLKTIVDSIDYTRDGDNIHIHVNFL